MTEAGGNEASGQVSGQVVQARQIYGDVHLHMDGSSRLPQGPPEDPALARLRDAYLRWLTERHRWAEAPLAGRRVRAPLAEVPARESLASDGSTPFARAVEVEHLGSRARAVTGDGEAPRHAVLAAQPLPTYLAAPGRVDRLDLSAGESVAAVDLLATTWRSVVLGDPGGGKSTLARRLTRQAAESAPTATHPAPESEARVWRLPLLCRASDLVRALADGAARSGQTDLAEVAIAAGWDAVPPFDPASGDTVPVAELHRLTRWHAERDGVLLVVDGLDEVPTLAERVALATALDNYAGGARLDRPDRAPGNQILVTSRVMGYHAAPLGERFDQLLLQPMDRNTAEEVGRYWVSAYAKDAEIGPAASDAFQRELDRRLASPRIGELAANPYLLVSLVSAVVSGTLQEHRGAADRWLRCDLYQVMVDDAVGRAHTQFPDASPAFLHDLHMTLAYRIHRDSRTGLVDRARLRETLGEIVAELSGADRWRDPDRASHLLEAAGLLVERGQSLYGFLHLTVAEYLAGRWLTTDRRDAPERVETVRAHLGDPRWVEPLRLGLGHLSRAMPEDLDRLVRGLLDGDHGLTGLELFGGALDDLAAVAPDQVRRAVEVALSAGPDATTSETPRPGALAAPAALVLPILSAPVPAGEERPATTVARTLTAALGAESTSRVDAAARLVEALPITDRGVAQALFEAQYADGSHRGWHTVRALHALLRRWEDAHPATHDTSRVEELLGSHGAEWRRKLGDVELRRTRVPAAGVRGLRGLRGGVLSGRTAPMRSALQRAGGPELLNWALARPAWMRLLICLYGGLPLDGAAALREERDRLLGVLRGGDNTDVERRHAAVRLDTVVLPALARAERLVYSAENITADTPLTPRVLEWLTGQVPTETVARHLATCAHDATLSPPARGDALAAHLVMTGALTPDGAPDLGPDTAVASRARWRLDWAWLHLRDAAAVVRPQPIVEALDRPSAPPPETAWAPGWPLAHPARTPPTDLPQLDTDLTDQPLTALFHAICVDRDAQRDHRVAVLIDVAGGKIDPDALAHACATVHRSGLDRSGDWPFDPLVPEPAEHRVLGAALGNLALLAPRWAFVRCWVLRRLAGHLRAAGLGVEAAALAWRDRAADPIGAHRALTRLLPALAAPAEPPDPEREPARLVRFLTGALDDVADPCDRARARVALAAAERRRLPTRVIRDLIAAVPDPHERFRVGEYAVALGAYAGAGTTSPDLRVELAADVGLITDPPVAAAARERLSRLGPDAVGVAEPVLRALTEVSGSLASWGNIDSAPVCFLVHAVCGNAREEADRSYDVAVALDTRGAALVHGEGFGLARVLAEAHRVPTPASADWPLDPNGPVTGLVLPEALTNLAALHPRWAFLRCWALDRLAPDLVADGYGIEALCLALRDLPADRPSAARTVGGLLARLESADPRGPATSRTEAALFARLSGLVERVNQPYPRARARLHLAALREAADFGPARLSELMATVPAATERVRLAELAFSLRIARPHPWLLRDVLAEADRMVDEADRARTLLRLRDVLDETDSVDRRPPSRRGRTGGSLSGPLLALERARGAAVEAPEVRLGWAVLTAAAYCADVLPEIVDATGPANVDEAWSRLAAAEHRAATEHTLLVAGERRPHELDAAVGRVLEELLAAGEPDVVARLLTVSRLAGHATAVGVPAFTDRLRGAADQRVADLATLLALEAGQVDTGTVAALPRLVADHDDRVRLRTGLALSTVSRGGNGPCQFSATRLGAPVLAALATLCAEAARGAPTLATEVGWMLSDVVHDSPAVLGAALDGLEASARAELLRRTANLRADFLDGLADHLLGLPPEDQVHALRAVKFAAANPYRVDLDEERVADLAAAVHDVAADAEDAVFAQALLVLGFALPATVASTESLLGELTLFEDGYADGAVGQAACHALGVLVRRLPEGLAAVPAVRATLDRIATTGPPELAAAAVGALARGGEPVEDRTGEIAPTTLARGLLTAVDGMLVGPTYEAEIRRVADFVTAPPTLSEADSDHHSRSLLAAMLEWAVRDAESDTPYTRAKSGGDASDILAVLAVLAARQPAAVREAVAAHAHDVPRVLREHLARTDNWVGRQSAAQILACLGYGDAATLTAVLATATDTDVVRRRVLERLPWFDSIEPDALVLLRAALDTPSLARARFAVEVLAALVRNGVLDTEQRRHAMEAIRAAADRPDGYRRTVREQHGQMMVTQPFAELCQATLRGLGARVAAEGEPHRGGVTSRIQVSGRDGSRLTVEVSEGAALVDPSRYQLEWWRDVRGNQVVTEVSTALGEVYQKAHHADVPTTALLAAVLAAEDG